MFKFHLNLAHLLAPKRHFAVHMALGARCMPVKTKFQKSMRQQIKLTLDKAPHRGVRTQKWYLSIMPSDTMMQYSN